MRIAFRIIVILILSVGSWNFGYWLAHSGGKSSDTVASKAKPESTSNIKPNTIPPFRPKDVTNSISPDKSGGNVGGASESGRGTYSGLVAAHHLEAKSEYFASVFSHTPVGQAFAQASTLLRYGPAVGNSHGTKSPEVQLISDQLKLIQSQPNEAINELKQNLTTLGTGYSQEIQYWVQIAGNLNSDPLTKLEFLSDELKRSVTIPSSGNTDPAPFNGVVTLNVMLNITEDSNAIEPAIRQAIANISSNAEKVKLLSVYSSKFPQQAQSLKAELGI